MASIAPDYRSYLVPGRECGDCVACCTALAIREEGLTKPVGVACQHCMGGGCAIYDSRPQLCRTYHCAWRAMPGLDESWRPDRSGVMIIWDTPPDGMEHAIDLVITGDPALIEGDRFLGLATGFIAQGVATRMSLPRGVGYLHVSILLNEPLRAAIAARDRAQARDLMRSIQAEMMKRLPIAEPFSDPDDRPLATLPDAGMEEGDDEDIFLVSGRECGTCTSCCTDLWIDEPVVKKDAGTPCRHCIADGGCAIYADRPANCRSFNCLWPSLPGAGEEWRPDRSGVLMMMSDPPEDAPADRPCVDLIVTGSVAAVQSDAFAGLVGGFLESGTTLCLNVRASGGRNSWRRPMNDLLAQPVASRDLAAIKARILAVYQDLEARPVVERPRS